MNNRIRYFVAVAEARHFARAAEKLHMSQPPLSQQIQLLEKQLGIQLLTRTTRRVELTEAGQILYEGAKRALDQLDQAILHAQRAQRGEAGLLRVGFVSTAAFQLLSEVLRAFRRRYPQATLELFHLTSAQQAAAFEARTIDVGFLREPPPGGDIEVEVIDREPLFVALPATRSGETQINFGTSAQERAVCDVGSAPNAWYSANDTRVVRSSRISPEYRARGHKSTGNVEPGCWRCRRGYRACVGNAPKAGSCHVPPVGRQDSVLADGACMA